MGLNVTLRDRTAFGKETGSRVLENLSETITLRELIRRRVTEEVEEFNRDRPELFRGLVQPSDAEATLNGYRLRKPDRIDPARQVEIALRAFEANGFFVLVGDRQVGLLDDPLQLKPDTDVAFVKLVPLVGG
jgi:hypothetical protein